MGYNIAGDAHAKTGLAVFFTCIIPVALGLIARLQLSKSTSGQFRVLAFKLAHKLFAYAFLIFAEITVALGIYWYNMNKCWKTPLWWLHLLGFFVPLVTLEIINQTVWLRRRVAFKPNCCQESKGQKYVTH